MKRRKRWERLWRLGGREVSQVLSISEQQIESEMLVEEEMNWMLTNISESFSDGCLGSTSLGMTFSRLDERSN
jgi:hypothetical protein